MSVPEYALMFSEINQPLQQHEIQSIEVSKTFRGQQSQLNVAFEPNYIQMTGSVNKGALRAQQTVSTQMHAVSQVGIQTDSLVANAILEVTPTFQQPSLVDQLRGMQAKVSGFQTNGRLNSTVRTKNSTFTGMYNQKGNIFAASNLTKIGPVLLGGEFVYIKDKDTKMHAIGAGFENEHVQVIGQINSEQSAAVGALMKTKYGNISCKTQFKFQDELKYQSCFGVQKRFNRGQIAVNIDLEGNLVADVKAVVSEDIILQVVANGKVDTGDLHVGVGVIF